MTAKEAVNWIINIMADVGKSEYRALWHYEQALMEIREMLETSAQPEPIKLHVDHALTEEEIKNLKHKIADSPIVLMPSAQPEMVKCKKCRYVYYDEEFGNYWCDRMSDPFRVEADGKWGK